MSKIDISRLTHFADTLIGRDAELARLDDAWTDPAQHVLVIRGIGGEGKTSLVAAWTAQLAGRNYDGASYFDWSFYSQGTRDQTAASSDSFLATALGFFGGDEGKALASTPTSARDKAIKLLGYLRQERTLLVLDGLETLQHPPGQLTGLLRDDAMSELLTGLAQSNPGLCIVTTRYSLPDLARWQTTAPEVPLLRLSREAGVELLMSLGVEGYTRELESLMEEVRGHALTLNLLGSYLHDAHDGDIRKRDLVKLEEANAEELGGHAFRVMDAYVESFESEGEKGIPALAVLRLLGLFDRPVTADCLTALLKAPAIPGLTKALVGLGEVQRNVIFSRLKTAKLLTVNRDSAHSLLSLDAHPLLRNYFANQLRTHYSDAWRAANQLIYEHLCATTKDSDQPTLGELQPLFQAVAHGCHAGLQLQAFHDVYDARINRGQNYYSMTELGAHGINLEVVACFFETPWARVSPTLEEHEPETAELLGIASFCLRALGRLTESFEPMRAGLTMHVKLKNWLESAKAANNLSELKLRLGEVTEAVAYGEQGVGYADCSRNAFLRLASRATHADALHQAGRWAEAETRFREAEQIPTEWQPDSLLLYSVRGFRYCDLLLAAPERAAWGHDKATERKEESLALCRPVSERAQKMQVWNKSSKVSQLGIALNHLALGRARLIEAIIDQNNFSNVNTELHLAISGLRRAGHQDYIPLGLLTRAWLRALAGPRTGPESAQADLDEAWDIAERGPMRLFMADIHLYRARLFFGEKPYPWAKNPDGTLRGPKDDLAAAQQLIKEYGYWRRKEELEDAEEAAKNWPDSPKTEPAPLHAVPAELKSSLKPSASPSPKGTATVATPSLSVSDLKGKIHAAIITIRIDEYEAMEARLGAVQSVVGNNPYKYAQIPTESGQAISVVLTRIVGQANLKALAVASNIIHELDPAWLILVGIAGGVPDYEFSLGDVVIATHLNNFSFSAVSKGTVTYQDFGGPIHRDVERFLGTRAVGADGKKLRQLAGFEDNPQLLNHPVVFSPNISDTDRYYGSEGHQAKVKDTVERRFPGGKRAGGPKVWQGPCANGDILVKDDKLLTEWQKSARQIVAVETELSGVYEAARALGREDYPVLAIRGLSDIVGFARDPNWTAYACQTAAAFTFAVLRSGFIDFAKKLPPNPQ